VSPETASRRVGAPAGGSTRRTGCRSAIARREPANGAPMTVGWTVIALLPAAKIGVSRITLYSDKRGSELT